MGGYYPFVGSGFNGQYGNLGLYGNLVAYGTLNLTEASPPQSWTEPLTLAEVKDYLRLPERSPVDSAEDAGLLALISAAREQAEILQNRDLVRKQWDLTMDYWPSYRIEMRAPVIGVDLVRYRDSDGNYTTLTEDVDYIVDLSKRPGLIAPLYNQTWPVFTPWPSSAILVRFRSGFLPTDPFWSDAGARVKIGMKRLISDWFNNRLPFEKGADAAAEYPFGVTSCLSYGALVRAK